MAGKKSRAELESLRSDVASLTEAVWALRDQVSTNAAHFSATASSRSTAVAIPADDLEQLALDSGESGAVRVSGFHASESATTRWSGSTPASALTDVNTQSAASLLAAVGHPQRLAILLALLEGSASASDLVANLSLGTTGAAYHHLNVLQTAGLITQVSRGMFRFQAERIPVFLTLLAAVSDAVQVQTDS